MRSPREISFRLKQLAANRILARIQPQLSAPPAPAPLPLLPDPVRIAAALQGSPFAARVVTMADAVCAHRIRLFSTEFDTGSEIRWRRDYQHSIETPPHYFRNIPYLDFARAGDHKYVWELNRHQHFVLLAQAWLLTGNRRYIQELESQWRSWFTQNPFQYGMNWVSALEVAFRALSWIWTWHLAGSAFDRSLAEQIWTNLNRHGLHLEYNLSIYFSPNTHLLGEAVALHALGTLCRQLPRAAHWHRLGRKITLEQLDFQVASDGSHFEQSTYYHVYAVDFFAFHHILEPLSAPAQEKLKRMVRFLEAILGPERRLSFFGDDDGGRLFHPYGDRDVFGRATVATCSLLFPEERFPYCPEDLDEQSQWWLGPEVCAGAAPPTRPVPSQRFSESGLTVMSDGEIHILADTGGFGYGGAGHSHSDALSLVIRRGAEEILIDPGTFTYISDIEWRNRFRGSGMHNTVRISGADQATPAGPFRWNNQMKVELLEWRSTTEADYLDARCGPHRRRFYFDKPGELLLILDSVEGTGAAYVEQFWNLGHAQAAGRMSFAPEPAVPMEGWRSRVLGSREPSLALRVQIETAAWPLRLVTAIDLSAAPSPPRIEFSSEDVLVNGRRVRMAG